ncbi:MAG TPA: FxSxx-COOH system tetratricopeptide repeat protein [Ktedonobacteraceae bacterium]|nr:FxSxx-COOH system tetratricopeptide repeat protein [Ktedonobacteraceae bacterium]
MSEENSFGALLTYLRKRSKLILARQGIGWTQAAIAEALEVSERTYKGWERGERVPDEYYRKKIAELFKLGTEDENRLYREAAHVPPKKHNLPFPQNPLFTGREALLDQVKEALNKSGSVALTQPVSISGLGGIGKTQLALEYAHRCFHEEVYRAVLWVSAADEATLVGDFVELAHTLELPEWIEQEQYKCVKAVKQWLEDHTNWLLLVDNADDLQLARSFFPEAGHGHILLTTRSQIIGNVAGEIIEIDKMEPAEGLLFLLRRTRRYGRLPDKTAHEAIAANVRDAALQIVDLLGGHPLALDQAGAYIEDNPLVSFTDFIDLYHKKRHDVLSERGSLDEENKGKYSEHPESVVVTFELCFAKAQERHPLATDILRFCAFLHPDAIPEELFQHDDGFKLDAKAFRKGIIALVRYSLLKINSHEKTASMHRLVQAVLIDAMLPDIQKQWRERVVRALSAAFPEADFENWKQCGRLVSHVLVCATWTEDELAQTVGVAQLLRRAANYQDVRGQYSEAEALLKRVLSILERHLKVGHPFIMAALNDLAAVYTGQREIKQAEFLLKRVLSEHTRDEDAYLPSYILSIHNLASLYINYHKDPDKHKQAETLLLEEISVLEKSLGTPPDTVMSLQIARSLRALAVLYGKYDMYSQAEALLVRAISIFKKHLEATHPDIVSALRWLAWIYAGEGEYEQAETLFKHVLGIQEQTLGSTHPETQYTKSNYSIFLRHLGRHDEAAALEANDELCAYNYYFI